MDSKALDKENAINTAIVNIKAGMPKKDILSILSKICPKVSAKTIGRYYNHALENCKVYNKKLDEAIEQKEVEIIGSTFQGMQILTKLQRQQILSEIAIGKVTHTKYVPTKFGVEVIEVHPTWSDRKAAISELNKMDGSYLNEIETEDDITEIVIKRISK